MCSLKLLAQGIYTNGNGGLHRGRSASLTRALVFGARCQVKAQFAQRSARRFIRALSFVLDAKDSAIESSWWFDFIPRSERALDWCFARCRSARTLLLCGCL